MTSVLIVDDETKIVNLVEAYLRAENYTTYSAADGAEALALFQQYQPDLIILDMMLPKIEGLELLQRIRRESDVYVLILTAKSEEMDRVIGLTVGADDYLAKPFSPRELVARVKAILRRGRNTPKIADPVYMFGDLRVDTQRHEVWKGEQFIELTALEFALLKTLAMHVGMVMDREQLLEQVWGYDYYGDVRVVDVHIGHIRRKLEDDPANPEYILTVRGVGYKLADKLR